MGRPDHGAHSIVFGPLLAAALADALARAPIWSPLGPPQANLSLYAITALLILDADGHRILAKYYSPPHAAPEAGHAPAASVNGQHPGGARLGPPGLSTLKEQKAFEKSVHEKTKRGGGEIHPLPPHLLLTKPSTDLSFHIVGPLATSNELMLQAALTAFHDAVSLLLRGQVEKRSVLEGLDMVVLAADELCDDGWARARHYTHVDTRADARGASTRSIILETDSTAIASRVSRPRADTTDIVINEQTILNACELARQFPPIPPRANLPARPPPRRLDHQGEDGPADRPVVNSLYPCVVPTHRLPSSLRATHPQQAMSSTRQDGRAIPGRVAKEKARKSHQYI